MRVRAAGDSGKDNNRRRPLKSHSTHTRAQPKPAKVPAQAPAALADAPRTGWRGWRFAGPALAAVLASVLLFWGLADKYLWQDEAQTAVLATRLLRFGRPLGYDGTNLISTDYFAVDSTPPGTLTTNPKTAVDYYIQRGDFRVDTSWTYHPLGQFLVAAMSLKLLGQTTLAARLPFALAGLATIFLLYRLVQVRCKSDSMALLATVLLIGNAFWILHSRQCRYYPLSSLFFVLTLLTYTRWQSGARWGATAFVITAWGWFQVDYGTVWPVFAVLCIDSFLAHRGKLWRPALAGLALGASIAPSVVYYQVWGRGSVHNETWGSRFSVNLFNMNQYVVPVLVLAVAAALLLWRWKTLPSLERRLVAVACGSIIAFSIWVPTATAESFLRYVIMVAPAGCLLSAWLLVRGCQGRTVYAWVGVAVLILTPWLSMPLHILNEPPVWYRDNVTARNPLFRGELLRLAGEVFRPPPDPNRMVIEWLKQNTQPTDEILVNYEDIPLMFYLPNPIRGGIAAFRVEDNAKKLPDFLVMRRSVSFVHWNVFAREVNRYRWSVAPVGAPDVVWGNNPDPMGETQEFAAKDKIIVARRTESGTARGVVFGNVQE
jgi:hypothetical protein